METPIILNGEHMPKPEGSQRCDCGRTFETWDLLACHITIVHNARGRTREFYGGNAPSEILNHPDWRGYQD